MGANPESAASLLPFEIGYQFSHFLIIFSENCRFFELEIPLKTQHCRVQGQLYRIEAQHVQATHADSRVMARPRMHAS